MPEPLRLHVTTAVWLALLSIAPVSAAAMQQAAPPSAATATAAKAQPLARATFLATMDVEFRKSDANKDGMVTKAELASQQQQSAGTALEQALRTRFAAMDANRNGQVSPEEFVRANAGTRKAIDVTPMMGRLDTNRDQRVSLVEYRTITLANFDRLDTDKDGFISPAEQRASGLAK